MANERLTAWYDGRILPIRSGVYERQVPNMGVAMFAYFNTVTQSWYGHSFTVIKAYSQRHLRATVQNYPWRGRHLRKGDRDD